MKRSLGILVGLFFFGTVAQAEWIVIEEEIRAGNDKETILSVLADAEDANFDSMLKEEARRQLAGYKARTILSIEITDRVLKWEDPANTCKPDDQRQFSRSGRREVSFSDQSAEAWGFLPGSQAGWNPCAENEKSFEIKKFHTVSK